MLFMIKPSSLSGFMVRMIAAGVDGSSSDFFDTFLKDKCIIDSTPEGGAVPVNPLNWWMQQRMRGNENDGWTQMALDVFSLPGESFVLFWSAEFCYLLG